MLTNNKKRGFVKLLALTLAALMVFSVCLTGCTDEDARKAAEDAQTSADKAQTTADAAQTEEEVAAAIAKALESYLKTEDALSSADVDKKVADLKSTIEASLKDYATTAALDKKQDKIDLSAYAKSADLTALTKKVTDHLDGALTEKKVNDLITAALAEYEIEKKIAAAIENIDTLSADAIQKKIEEAISETLKNYYTKDETDAKIKAALEAYFGEYTAEEVVKLLATMEKAMTTDEWNKATSKVLATLKLVQEFFGSVGSKYYTYKNKALINSYFSDYDLTVFKKNGDGTLADYKAEYMHDENKTTTVADATNKILSEMTVQILRAPNVEYIQGILDAVTKATQVPDWTTEIAEIRNDLYALGELAKVDSNRDGKADTETNAEYKYHGVTYKKGADVVAQVVTVADQTAFNTINDKLNDLVIEYALGSANFSSYYGITLAGKWVNGNTTKYYTAGTFKSENTGYGFTYVGSISNMSGYTLNGYVLGTVGSDNNSFNTRAYWTAPNAPTTGQTLIDYYDNQFCDPQIKTDRTYSELSSSNGWLVKILDEATVNSKIKLSATYAAIIQMLADAKQAVDKANDLFSAKKTNSFLWKIGFNKASDCRTHNGGSNNTCKCTFLTDDQYVEALTEQMCEKTLENGAGIVVSSTWQSAPWLSPNGSISSGNALFAPWNITNTDADVAKTVEVYMNYALNINGKTHNQKDANIGITKYDLYLRLIDKAWDVLFVKYQNYALDILQLMVNDYTVAANAAYFYKNADSDSADYVSCAPTAAAAMQLYNTSSSKVWSEDFVNAFYNGTTFAWKTKNGVQVGITYTMPGLAQYYKNNEAAKVAEVNENKATTGYELVNVNSDVLGAIAANVNTIYANNNVYIEVSSVSVAPRDSILTASLEAKKAAGGSVQHAFDGELETAKKNMDEIINRYIFEDVKKAMLNDVYAYITSAANKVITNAKYVAYPQNVYSAGIAEYFTADMAADDMDAAKAAIIEVLEWYVTGVSASSSDSIGFDAQLTKAQDGTIIAVVLNYLNSNNSVQSALDDIVVVKDSAYNAYDKNFNNTLATSKIAEAQALVNTAIKELANEAVKYRFADYLKEAKDALLFAKMSYETGATTYTLAYDLTKSYNTYLGNITNIEYMFNLGLMNQGTLHFDSFVGTLLNTVIAQDSTYYALVSSKPADQNYAAQVKKIKSASVINSSVDLAAKKGEPAVTELVDAWKDADSRTIYFPTSVPTSSSGNLPIYNATGEAMIAFDKIINANASYKTGNKTTKLY